MQPYDLAGLCDHFHRQLPNNMRIVVAMVAISKALKYASDKKVDKDGERYVKQMLYRMETLFREIEDAMEESGYSHIMVAYLMIEINDGCEGSYSKALGKSLRSFAVSEIELIAEELSPYTTNEQSLIIRDYMVGTEFHNKKEELIQLLLDSNSGPIVVIPGKPGSGKSTLLWDALHDSRLQMHSYLINAGKFSFRDRIDWEYRNKKWLTVLDDRSDVNEIKYLTSVDIKTLLNLSFFKDTGKGSKIVIASNLDLDYIGASKLSLPSLDEDESWSLFKKTASIDRESPLLTIGGKICQKCEKIPGVINIVASILSSRSTTEEWEHFLHVMTCVPDPINTISSTIEFTKRQGYMRRILGHCFAWCSLLPKDYEFRPDQLFHLWKTQDYFPLKYEQVGGAYDQFPSITNHQLNWCFYECFRRGYFVKTDTIGFGSYKINHLAFELMKYVAGDDFCLVDNPTTEPNHKIVRHVSFIVDRFWEPPSWLSEAKQVHSLLLWPRNPGEFISLSKMDMTLLPMTQLRIFYAEGKHELYPAFLAKLKRLKFIRLGLFPSITLPKGIPALKKILHIDIQYISTNNLAPDSVDRLTDGNFGEEERRALLVQFTTFKKFSDPRENLNELNLLQTYELRESSAFDEDDYRLASLNPHQSVENLLVCGWKGETVPLWKMDESSVFFHSLLSIQIANCDGCQHLPGFDTLPLLNSLQLWSLHSLTDITISGENSEASSTKLVYPSLKCLVLYDLPEFKGWSSTEPDDGHHIIHHFSTHLTQVRVEDCPKMISMPLVPKLESLKAVNVDVNMLITLRFPPLIDDMATAKTPYRFMSKPRTS